MEHFEFAQRPVGDLELALDEQPVNDQLAGVGVVEVVDGGSLDPKAPANMRTDAGADYLAVDVGDRRVGHARPARADDGEPVAAGDAHLEVLPGGGRKIRVVVHD